MKEQYKTAGLVAVIAVLVFANTLPNRFVYDDMYFIVDNPAIKSLKNVPDFFTSLKSFSPAANFSIYRPLATLSYAIGYAVLKLNPFIFHLFSVLWHAAVCAMLYFTLALMLRDKSAALLASLIFSVHPAQTETVAWVSQQSNLISLFFFLLSFHMWIRMSGIKEGEKRKIFYAVSAASYGIALLGKEMAVSLPLILLLYDIYAKQGIRKKLKLYAPFLMTTLLYVILRTLVLGRVSGQDQYVGGSLYKVALAMIKSYGFYMRVMLLPVKLCVGHIYGSPKSLLEPAVVLSLAAVAVLLALALFFSVKRRQEGFFVLWFFVTLLPVSNIIPLQQVIAAERFLYFPSIGFCVLVSLAVLSFGKKAARVIILLLLIPYAGLTIKRNGEWKDEISLWEATVRVKPDIPDAYYNLGVAYGKKGLRDREIECYERAVRLNPGFSLAQNNLGAVYVEMGRFSDAIQPLRRAIRMDPRDPRTYCNLGVAYVELGRYREAIECYRRAVSIAPDFADLYFKMGWAYMKMGDKKSALEQCQILNSMDRRMAAELFRLIAK